MDDFDIMLHIAEQSKFGQYETSTGEIAGKLGLSQQTVSRKLVEFEQKGLIRREAAVRGMIISIEGKGIALLRERYGALQNLLEKKAVSGIVRSGIGEGGYYVGQKGYGFKEKLGFVPYAGTLNVQIEPHEVKAFITNLCAVTIPGFKARERTYGALTAYKVRLGLTDAAIIIPERTTHPETIIEIIAPPYLRQKLKLKDGMKVTIEAP